MSRCAVHDAGTVELYFYGELDPVEAVEFEHHARRCRACADGLGELRVIRDALSARPEVSAPPDGDWTAFMSRLDQSLESDARKAVLQPAGHDVEADRSSVLPFAVRAAGRPLAGWLAMAALLAIVALGVFFASPAGRQAVGPPSSEPTPSVQASAQPVVSADGDAGPIRAGLTNVGIHHLERSKLVVLGLATRDTSQTPAEEWAYERELATGLLNDTRLYRMAAESRGLSSLAAVMKDLELVLLQASMAEPTDTNALPQIQRLIRRRGLVEKMNVAGTTGLLP